MFSVVFRVSFLANFANSSFVFIPRTQICWYFVILSLVMPTKSKYFLQKNFNKQKCWFNSTFLQRVLSYCITVLLLSYCPRHTTNIWEGIISIVHVIILKIGLDSDYRRNTHFEYIILLYSVLYNKATKQTGLWIIQLSLTRSSSN